MIDGVSIALAKKHSSKYSNIFFWYYLAIALSPIVSSFTIKDSEDNLHNDYSLTYYIADGVFLICVLTIFTKVDFKSINSGVDTNENNSIHTSRDHP